MFKVTVYTAAQDIHLTTASPEPTEAPHRRPATVDDPSFNDRLSDL